jgi:hypothetical protein
MKPPPKGWSRITAFVLYEDAVGAMITIEPAGDAESRGAHWFFMQRLREQK